MPRAEARRRILAAARSVLERDGFAALTVDGVMGEAGLARTAFYRHFDGRGHLVAALLEDVAAELGPQIAPAEDLEAVDDAGGMRELLDVGVALARRHGALLRAADEARHADEDVRRAHEAFLRFLVGASLELVRARAHVPGARTPPVTEDVVRALIDLNTRVLLEWEDLDAAREALFVIWARTLGVKWVTDRAAREALFVIRARTLDVKWVTDRAAREALFVIRARTLDVKWVTDRAGGRSAPVSATTATPAGSHARPTAATFEALYRDTADDLFAYVAALVRDRGVAEEVVAAAFERAYRRVGTYDPRRGTTRQWLFGIARHAALDELRRRRRTAALVADPADAAAAADDAHADPVRRAAVGAALAALDVRDRELVALKFFAGLDNAEIAGVLGISATNAGTRLHRAVQRLREACHAPS